MRMLLFFLSLGILAACAPEPQKPIISHHPLLTPAPDYVLPDVSKEPVAYIQLTSSIGVLGGVYLQRVDGKSVVAARFTDSNAVRDAYDAAIQTAPSKDQREGEFLPVRTGTRSFLFTYGAGIKWSDLFTLSDPARKTVELVGSVREGRFWVA